MNTYTEEGCTKRTFKVLPSVPCEEYILSDTLTSSTSLSSRLHKTMGLMPKEHGTMFDLTSKDKNNLDGLMLPVKSEVTEKDSQDNVFVKKEENNWDSTSIIEELMEFTNSIDNFKSEQLKIDLNTTESQKSQMSQDPFQLLLSEYKEDININEKISSKLQSRRKSELDLNRVQTSSSTPTWPKLPDALINNTFVRDCNENSKGSTLNMTNCENISNRKIREIKHNLSNKILVNGSPKNSELESNNRFSKHPKPGCFQNMAVVPKKTIYDKYINSFNTSLVVSSNTDLLKSLLKSAPSSSEHKRDGTKKNSDDKPEVILLGESSEDEGWDDNNRNNVNVSGDSTVIQSVPNKENHSNKSKKINVAESEVIEVNDSSSDGVCDESGRDSVITFGNNIWKGANIEKSFTERSGSLNTSLNKICENSETDTCIQAPAEARRLILNTSDSNMHQMNTATESRVNIPDEDYSEKSCSVIPTERLKVKKKLFKRQITKTLHKAIFIPTNLVKRGSHEQLGIKPLRLSNKHSAAVPNPLDRVHDIILFPNKRKGSGGHIKFQQSSRPYKRVMYFHTNVVFDKNTKDCNSMNLSNDKLPKSTEETTQNIGQGPVLTYNTHSKGMMDINMICSENSNIVPTLSTSTATASQSFHSSCCQCFSCKIRKATSGEIFAKSHLKCVCCLCNKGFSRQSHLNRHMSAVHSEIKQFVCYQCCKGYKSKVGLDYHILRYHNKSTEKSKCEKCHKYFPNNDTLNRHVCRAHLKLSNNLPEACDICQKIFKSRNDMQNHRLRKHNSLDKEFICNDCSAVFSDKNKLICHIQRYHMPPTLKCSLCSEVFALKIQLQTHLRKEHGKDNRKTYICETCGKTTKNIYGLKNHIKIHSKIKPFVCEECGKTFRTVTNLHQHSRIHSDVRPYSCDICGNSFRIRHHLQQHMAVHGMASTPNYSKRARRKTVTSSTSSESSE